MPVINLPRDERWGDLGKGLGSVLGAVISTVADNAVQQGVAQIQQDGSIPEDKKPMEIQKKFGPQGIAALAKINALSEQQATIKNTLALGKLNDIKAQLGQYNLDQVKALQGGEGQVAGGDVTEGLGLTADQQVRARGIYKQALLSGEKNPMTALKEYVDMVGGAAKRPLEMKVLEGSAAAAPYKAPIAAGEAAAAPYKAPEAKATLAGKEQAVAAAAPVAITPEQIKQAFPNFSDEQAQAAALAATTEGKKGLSQTVNRQVAATQVQPTRVQDADIAAKSSEYATTLKNFADNLIKSPETGLLTGATIKAYLERHGVSSGDPALLNMLESQSQAVAQQAKTGGSMMLSNHSIALARDITTNISRTPLANIVAMNLIADQQIKVLQQRALALQGSRQSIAPHEQAIKDWEEVKNITGSLDSYVTKDNRTVILFQGNEINPNNLKARFEGGVKSYKVGPSEVDGATVLSNARMAGVTPEQWLAAAKAHVGE